MTGLGGRLRTSSLLRVPSLQCDLQFIRRNARQAGQGHSPQVYRDHPGSRSHLMQMRRKGLERIENSQGVRLSIVGDVGVPA